MRRWVWGVGLLLAAVLLGGRLITAVAANRAHVALNQLLGESDKDPAQLVETIAAKYDVARPFIIHEDESPLQAFFIGEYHWRRDEKELALLWWEAATAEGNVWQTQERLTWYEMLGPDGQLWLTDFAAEPAWYPQVDADGVAVTADSTLVTVQFENNPTRRDRLAYSFFPNPTALPLQHHHMLSSRVWVSEGSYLTLETVVDGERQRHQAYVVGNDDWLLFEVPLAEGAVLREVKWILSEPNKAETAVDHYEFRFDWLKLELP